MSRIILKDTKWREAGGQRAGPTAGDMETVLSPILSARMPQPEAEETALGAHAVGNDGVRPGGGILLPHYRR